MNIKLVVDLYKNRNSSSGKKINFINLIGYFLRLKIGEITGRVYGNDLSDKPGIHNITEFLGSLETFDTCIRETLCDLKMSNVIDICKKLGLENIGIGCFITSRFGQQIGITQGKADFYFATRDKKSLTLTINLMTIPKISGEIKFEEKTIHSFTINTLASYNISVKLEPELIKQKVSKISISTNKIWYPKYLDPDFINIPLGVGIKSIELS